METFGADWGPLAIKEVDDALANSELQSYPELLAIIKTTKKALQTRKQEVTAVVSPLERAERKISEQVAMAVDGVDESNSRGILHVIERTRIRISLLRDIYDFQIASNKKRGLYQQKFCIGQRKDFLTKYPQYAALNEHEFSDFFRNYRGLIGSMNFPVLPDEVDVEDIKDALINDLWRIYNCKNKLPADNRCYKPGSKLPLLRESYFGARYFATAFGGFDEAVMAVLFPEKTVGKETEIEQIDPETVSQIIHLSLVRRRIPDAKDAGYQGDWDKAVAFIRLELETELKKGIDTYGIMTPYHLDPKQRYEYFHWAHLLLESKYFREFGVLAFETWIEPARLQQLTNHPLPNVEKRLKDAFFGDSRLRHMRQMRPVFHMTADQLESLKKMSDPELRQYVEQEIIKRKFTPSVPFNRKNVLKTLEIFVSEGITSFPMVSHFQWHMQATVKSVQRLRDKAALFREHPEIPFYMRHSIYNCFETSVERIRYKIERFRKEGIRPELYVHFLHLTNDLALDGVAHSLNKVDMSAKLIKQHHELLAKRKEEKETALKSQPQETKKTGKQLRKRAQKKEKSDEALHRLNDLGYPYEKFPAKIQASWSPVCVLEKVELMLQTMGCVVPSYLVLSLDKLREKADKRNSTQNEEEMQKFLTEKGLTSPPAYIKNGRTLDRIRKDISYIESRGVPFRSEYWWWLNLSEHGLESQIEHQWVLISREARREELAEIYRFEINEVPERIMGKDPDFLRKYCKVTAMAGEDATSYWSAMHAFSVPRYRQYLAKKIRNRSSEFTAAESRFLERQGIIDRINYQTKKPIKDLEIIVDDLYESEAAALNMASSGSLAEIERFLMPARKRVERKMLLEKRFRKHRLGYSDMDYFTQDMDRVEYAMSRLDFLERMKEPVTQDSLYKNIEELDVIRMCDENNLSEDQKLTKGFLVNAGCEPLYAAKIARSASSLSDVKAKVRFFMLVELDSSEYGKSQLEIDDYEHMLDMPMAYCTKMGILGLKRRLIYGNARASLVRKLGIVFDHNRGWVMKRTTPATQLQKFNFLCDSKSFSAIEPYTTDLVARYSSRSLGHVRKLADKIYKASGSLHFTEKQREAYVVISIEVLNILTRMLSRVIVSERIITLAHEKLLNPDDIMVKRICSIKDGDTSQTDHISREQALGIYRQLVNLPQDLSQMDALCVRRQGGDPQAINKMVELNLKLPYVVARKFHWANVPVEDLIQEGNFGLMRAAQDWDYTKGSFASYARWWIMSYMQKYVRNTSHTVRIPMNIQQEENQYLAFLNGFRTKNGREPTEEEIYEHIGKKGMKVHANIQKGGLTRGNEVSLDAPINNDDDGYTRYDTLGQTDEVRVQLDNDNSRTMFIEKLRKKFMQKYKAQAGTKEKIWQVFMLRFGFNEDEEVKTLNEIGEEMGFTRERARQLESMMLDFIRNDDEMSQILQDLI